jgi:ABC-type transport system involved in multi-copper enzyme maturation permease subunit
MNQILETFSQQIGMNIFLFALIIVWTTVWKLIALWKAARNKHTAWFIIMAVINTMGILPILYIFLFQDIVKKERKIEEVKEIVKKNHSKKVARKKVTRKGK